MAVSPRGNRAESLIAAVTFFDIRASPISALYLTIAAWAFLTGIFELLAAVQLRKHISNEIWLIIGGLAIHCCSAF